MKKLLIYIFLFSSSISFAQQEKNGFLNKKNLKKVYLTENVNLLFISPETIQLADISTKSIIGDLPIKNILRLKLINDSVKNTLHENSLGVVSIIGEKFIAQYNIIYSKNSDNVQTQIEIQLQDTNPLDVGNKQLSQNELHKYAIELLSKRTKKHIVRSKAYNITAQLNNVYTLDKYIFIDLTYTNHTNLIYDIDQIRFKISDKKVEKATNIQDIEIKAIYQLYENKTFKRNFRNIFVFEKFTHPESKVFSIEMTEKQISGRIITLQTDYSDLLNADTL